MRVLTTGLFALLVLLTGCAVTRNVTIRTLPPDALVKVNGRDLGVAPVNERLVFNTPADIYYISASRKGFQDRTIQVTRDDDESKITLELQPHVRRISISTSPVPAIISVDDVPITPEPVSAVTTDVEFSVDANDNWKQHVIRAKRNGFVDAERVVTWEDNQAVYNLKLESMHKDLSIQTSPSGATVSIDGQELGRSPVVDRGRAFEFDTLANKWLEHTVKVAKPGYDAVERKIGWDAGQTEYLVDLVPKQKKVVITTDPPGATVEVDDAPALQGKNGATATLVFAPVDEKGTLPTHKVRVTHKDGERSWYPADQSLAWDDGKTDYVIKLREVLSRPMEVTRLNMTREKGEWELKAATYKTLTMQFAEEPGERQATAIVKLEPGKTIGSFTLSPDGRSLVYTVIGTAADGPTSLMYRVATSGEGAATSMSDGNSVDLTPSFTPAGDRIVFSTNRASRNFSIWSVKADGTGGVTRYTTGETNDLFPSVDAQAKPRLFYEAYIDTRPDTRLYVVPIGANLPTDLTTLGGHQPKPSPKNDAVVYVLPNEKTGRRDIYKVADTGGPAEVLTTSDADYTDPAWNSSGTKIAFASDRAKDTEAGKNNYDIWVRSMAGSQEPVQITANGSVDDMPVWDPTGGSIYFRSNRGGVWGIWKIAAE